MPEGVEVKLSADLIRPLVVGQRVLNAVPSKKGRYGNSKIEGFEEFLKQLEKSSVRIKSVDNKGKFMYWTFDNDWYLFSTFGMTGQWSPQEGKHPCFSFYLGESTDVPYNFIYFNDPRHFGTLKFVHGKNNLEDKLNDLGWDPLDQKLNNFNILSIKSKINSSKPIGQLLMDQSIFAGVGNYIRAEALYLSKISPWLPGSLLSVEELSLLCESIVTVMEDSYKYQGATIQTYKTPYGSEGKYTSFFKVYRKSVDPFGNKVIRESTPDKRTIYWSPTVQMR